MLTDDSLGKTSSEGNMNLYDLLLRTDHHIVTVITSALTKKETTGADESRGKKPHRLK